MFYKRLSDVEETFSGHGHSSKSLLGEEEGCTNKCAAGVSYYADTEYTPIAVHDFQEGFMVISGKGWAKIGDEEIFIEKGTAFIVPKNVTHQLKSAGLNERLTLFFFHAKA